jgi:hypothetical protein
VKKVVKDEKYKDQWRKLGLFKRVWIVELISQAKK